ncbi:MAG: hypothetical protein HQK63_10750 [Desulfamplus sp.]|nr:hypothetical protein [Desulfamplus sp.]
MENNIISTESHELLIINTDSFDEFQKNTLSLEQEVEIINRVLLKTEGEEQELMAMRTAAWVELGILLIEHKKHVEAADLGWVQWARKNFPKLNKTRRQQCMFIAEAGKKAEQFYYMGFDRLYDLFGTLKDYIKDPDFQYVVKEKYGNIFTDVMQTDEDKQHYKICIDIIQAYFKFKTAIKISDFNRDSVLAVLRTGYRFKDADYSYLNHSLVPSDKVEEYFRDIILTGNSSNKNSKRSKSMESLQHLLAKMGELIEHCERTGLYPQTVPADYFGYMINKQINFFHTMYGTTNNNTASPLLP